MKIVDMKKVALFFITLFCYSSLSFSQNIMDFFYSTKYESVFIPAITLESNTTYREKVSFRDNASVMVKEMYASKGYYSNWTSVYKNYFYLKYTSNTISCYKTVSYNMFFPDGQAKNKTEIILALPNGDKVKYWDEKYTEDGKTYVDKCSSSWVYIGVQSIPKRAILITKQSGAFGVTTKTYWAEGIGFIKEEHISKGRTTNYSWKEGCKDIKIYASYDEYCRAVEQYEKDTAWEDFVGERKYKYFKLEELSPALHDSLVTDFGKLIIEKGDLPKYHIGSFAYDFEKESKYSYSPRSKNQTFRFEFSKKGVGSDITSPNIPDIDFKQWLTSELEKYSTLVPYYEVEPISNRRYYYENIKGFLSVEQVFQPYVLKVKLKKGQYVLLEGDQSTWEQVQDKLKAHLHDTSQKGTVVVSLLKVTCDKNSAYYYSFNKPTYGDSKDFFKFDFEKL